MVGPDAASRSTPDPLSSSLCRSRGICSAPFHNRVFLLAAFSPTSFPKPLCCAEMVRSLAYTPSRPKRLKKNHYKKDQQIAVSLMWLQTLMHERPLLQSCGLQR